MNPKTWNQDDRRVVWTVSVNDCTRYCIYVQGVLTYEDVSLEEFWPLYNSTVRS